MKISEDKIERIYFVKYLLKQAEISKDLNRPLSSTTILTLHDSVECFLQLIYEQLTENANFSSGKILETYSGKINEELKKQGSTQINMFFIKRLN